MTHHPETLSKHLNSSQTPELISHRWKCCSHLGSALTEGSCPFHSVPISPAEEQQTSQVLRSCTPLLSVVFLHKVRGVSQTVHTLVLHPSMRALCSLSLRPWVCQGSGVYGAEQALIGSHQKHPISTCFGHGYAPSAIPKVFWETTLDRQILVRTCTHSALGEIPLWTALVHTHSLCSILPWTKGKYWTKPAQRKAHLSSWESYVPQKRAQKLVIGKLLLWNTFYEQKDYENKVENFNLW